MRSKLKRKAAPRTAALLPATVLTATFCLWAGYPWMFANRQPYDDEGYYQMSLSHFHLGDFYAKFGSSYGPAYHEVVNLPFALLHLPVTADTGRWLSLIVWAATACLAGLVVFRISSNIYASVAGVVMAFWSLTAFTNEPLQPAIVFVPLALLLVLIESVDPINQRRGRIAVVGAGAATAALCKPTIGLFYLLAIVLTFGPAFMRRGRWWFAGSFLLVPVAYGIATHQGLYGLEIGGAIGAVGAVIALWPTKETPDVRFLHATQSFALGAAGVAIAACGIAQAMGNSLLTMVHTIFEGMLLFPRIQADALPGMSHVFVVVLILCGASIVARNRPAWSLGVKSLAAAVSLGPLVVFLVATRHAVGSWPFYPPQAPRVVSVSLNVFPMLCSLGSVPAMLLNPGRRLTVGEATARRLLGAIGAYSVLQIFPIAGSQVWFAEMPLFLASLICLFDVVSQLTIRGLTVAGPISVALVAGALWVVPWEGGKTYWANYWAAPALQISGASLLHSASDSSVLPTVIGQMQHEHCQYLATFPGLLSFYTWTGLQPPPGLLMTDDVWWEYPPYADSVISALSSHAGTCLIRNKDLQSAEEKSLILGDKDRLISFLDDHFDTVLTRGEFSVSIQR